MLKSVRSKVLALLAALGLGAGVVVTFTSDGCTVKPAQPTADAGVVEVVPVEDAGVGPPAVSEDAGSPDAGQ